MIVTLSAVVIHHIMGNRILTINDGEINIGCRIIRMRNIITPIINCRKRKGVMLLSADNQIAAHYCGRGAIDRLYMAEHTTKYPQTDTTRSLPRGRDINVPRSGERARIYALDNYSY